MYLQAPVTRNPLLAETSPTKQFDSSPMTMSCGLRAHALVGEDSRRITDSLAKLAGLEKNRNNAYNFPGPSPVSIDRGHFDILKKQRHYLTEKTDGTRICVYFTKLDDVNMIVMFDRTMSTPYICGPVDNVPKSLFQGTLLDAEIVQIQGIWTVLIFDAIFVSGSAVYHLPFLDRLSAIREPLTKFYVPAPGDLLVFMLKNFHDFTGPDSVLAFEEYLKTVPCATDGVILMPANDSIVYARHDALFKLKTHHTIDFMAKNKKLLIFDPKIKRNVIAGIPAGPNRHLADVDGAVLECEFDGKNWCPIHVRTDKTNANDKFTLDKTLLNIRENLTLGEIASAL